MARTWKTRMIHYAKEIMTYLHKAEAASLPRFANTPMHLRIDLPRRISHPEYMTLGNDIVLGPGSLLVAVTENPAPEMSPPSDIARQRFSPRISLGNRVTATGGLTVAAHNEIVIEDDVLFASNVNLTDALHGYSHIDLPFKYQPMERIAPIRIGRGCWIGENVVITPGVTIGELSIIGANSVVTCSIPPRCIAFGAPATVRKRWDERSRSWVPVAQDSELQAAHSREQIFRHR